MRLTHDIRIWGIRFLPKASLRPYNVRWRLRKGDEQETFSEYFATSTQADSFRGKLLAARAEGQEFDLETGLPVRMLMDQQRKAAQVTWYAHAREYALYKWPRIAGKSRASVAEVLITLTLALVPAAGKGRPRQDELVSALRRTAFNGNAGEPSEETALILAWVEEHSPAVGTLADLDTTRRLLDWCARRRDGKPASATYLARRRQVFFNVLKYAVTKDRLSSNPLGDPKLDWEKPSDMDTDHEVDPRSVGSPKQVEDLLACVSYVGRGQGPRFLAFFACMFYGMLRPGEVIGLRIQDCRLPAEGWGELVLEKSNPSPGRIWTDSGDVHDDRGLKHRSRKSVRPVPIPPELVRLLRAHHDAYGAGKGGRLFRSVNGNLISPSTYNRVWHLARELGLPPGQRHSVLLARPYDLRHSGVTVRLYAGTPERQVAEWAGHSVEVLNRVYSKILSGFDQTWYERIDRVLGQGSSGA